MIGKVFWGIMMVLVTTLSSLEADIQVTAKIDTPEIPLYQRFNYDIEITGDNLSEMPSVSLPPIDKALQVVSQSQSSSVRMMNGVVSAQVTYRFGIVAQAEGPITIGAAKVVLKGTTYQTNPIRITVLKPLAAAAPQPSKSGFSEAKVVGTSEALFLKAKVDRKSVYIGQDIIYTVSLYRRINLWDQLTLNSTPQLEGVYTEDLPVSPDPTVQELDGVKYLVQDLLKKRLTPLSVGSLTLPKIEIGYVANPFEGRQSAASEPLTLTVQALPEAPTSGTFSGVIGRVSLTMSPLSQTVVTQNMPITVRLTVSGAQRLDRLNELSIVENEAFKVYKSSASDGQTSSGFSRKFEYVVIPKRPGKWAFPQFSVMTFSPEEKRYVMHTTETPVLEVKAEPSAADSAPVSGGSSIAKKKIQNEIRYLKPYLKKDGTILRKSPWVWLGILLNLGMLSVLGSRLLSKIRRPKRVSHRGRIRAWKAMSHPFTPAQFAALHQSILDACSETFLIPFNPLSHSEMLEVLQEKKVPDYIISTLFSCLERSSYSAYTPGEKPDSNVLVNNATDLLIQLDAWRAQS